MSLRRRIEQFIEENALFAPQTTVVVAVSGGPDSLCLLELLTEFSANWRLKLHVAHLNHGLRPEAAQEAERVRAEAEARGWPFHTQAVDTKSHAAHNKQSLEEAARNLRYQFLAEMAQHANATTLATAHTQNDQAETVLMHFLRGSGLSGLKGMVPKMEHWRAGEFSNQPVLSLVRPLLATSRAEVEAYCAERGLQPLIDASNSDATFFRNRLRHELLPALENYNPNIYSVLSRTATVLAGEHALLQETIDQHWHALAQPAAHHVQFALANWRTLSAPLQRALLRRAVHHLRPGLRDIDFTPLEAARQWSQAASTGRTSDVTAGLCLSVGYEELTVREWEVAEAPSAAVPQLAADGKLAAGWEFRATPLPAWNLAEVEQNANPFCAYIDAQNITEPITLRARQDGDRLQPLGHSGHSKLSDLFINHKIDAPLRARWPLAVSGAAILWVPGLCVAEPFKVTAQSKTVIKLELMTDNP